MHRDVDSRWILIHFVRTPSAQKHSHRLVNSKKENNELPTIELRGVNCR